MCNYTEFIIEGWRDIGDGGSGGIEGTETVIWTERGG